MKYIPGVPSPVKHPERMNIIIFRENTEDVYAGIEWQEGTPQAKRMIEFVNKLLREEGTKKQIRPDSGVGIKPISMTATKQLVRRALRYALDHGIKTVTLVHKGNIMKFTEGAFRDWGYELAKKEFRQQIVTERESWAIDNKDKNPNLSIEANAAMVEPGLEMATEAFKQQVYKEVKDCLDSIYATHGKGQWKKKIMVNDRIADSIFQQVQTRADEYQILCTPNLNGDYVSDACAAQIGGLGVAPGANIGDGYGVFEATHGTAPKYADKDVINPGAVIRSGVLMFEFMGWPEVGEPDRERSGRHHRSAPRHLRPGTVDEDGRHHRRAETRDQRFRQRHHREHGQGEGARRIIGAVALAGLPRRGGAHMATRHVGDRNISYLPRTAGWMCHLNRRGAISIRSTSGATRRKPMANSTQIVSPARCPQG